MSEEEKQSNTEEKKLNAYELHVKRFEEKVKIVVIFAVALASFIIWFMLNQ